MNESNAIRESMIHYIANREWIRRNGVEDKFWWVGSVAVNSPFPTSLLGFFKKDIWYPMGLEHTADVPAADPKEPYALIAYCATYPHIMAVVRSLSDQELVESIEKYADYYDRDPLDTSRKVEL